MYYIITKKKIKDDLYPIVDCVYMIVFLNSSLASVEKETSPYFDHKLNPMPFL